MYYLIYGFLFLLGSFLFLIGIRRYNDTRELLTNGIVTTSTVIDLIVHYDSEGDTYAPLFEYYTANNEKRTFKSEINSRPASYKVGERVSIVYDTTNEKNVKTISYWGLYRNTIILLSVAMPLLIIGGGYFLYLMKMK